MGWLFGGTLNSGPPAVLILCGNSSKDPLSRVLDGLRGDTREFIGPPDDIFHL
jgi:hypothetical protein